MFRSPSFYLIHPSTEDTFYYQFNHENIENQKNTNGKIRRLVRDAHLARLRRLTFSRA
jgi:hypothetical protein